VGSNPTHQPKGETEMQKTIIRLKEECAEIENMIERLKELSNPQKNLKIVIDGIINNLTEAQQGLQFVIKLLENYDSIQHYGIRNRQIITVE